MQGSESSLWGCPLCLNWKHMPARQSGFSGHWSPRKALSAAPGSRAWLLSQGLREMFLTCGKWPVCSFIVDMSIYKQGKLVWWNHQISQVYSPSCSAGSPARCLHRSRWALCSVLLSRTEFLSQQWRRYGPCCEGDGHQLFVFRLSVRQKTWITVIPETWPHQK